MRLSYGRTFLLGSAFFGVQVLFAIYNAYVPIFLQSGRADFPQAGVVSGGFGLGAASTGLIMALDNLAAIMILPYIGALSDATVSGLGKRKPYILAGAPLAAVAFAALPLMLGRPLWLFMLVVVLMIVAVSIIRTPIFALMPDVTPSPLRSQANGVINLMGGIGAIAGFLVGAALYRQSARTPFFFGAAALLVGCLLVAVLVPVPAAEVGAGAGSFWERLRDAVRNQRGYLLDDLQVVRHDGDRSLLYLLATIFCLFLAFSALTVFFTSFAVVNMRVARGQEAGLLTFFALAIVVFALPAGLIGARIGRKRAMVAGLLTFMAATTPMALITQPVLIRALLGLSGIGWSLIVVNALPMVLDSAPPERLERIGTYTGLYFLATQSAEVVGPVLAGSFLDLAGRDYRLLFVYTTVVALAALAVLARVRRGEARAMLAAPAAD